jgi:hypothetical protein
MVPGLRGRRERAPVVRPRLEIPGRLHPALEALAEDLLDRLDSGSGLPWHRHLPRLDWPQGYQPFCTWLALSTLPHGYQAGPQLNVGVHRDHVAARLGWDVAADAFGRFEFRCRHAHLGEAFEQVARERGLAFRVYAAAAWPEGSRLVHRSDGDWKGAFDEAARRGVWWELGRRWEIPGDTVLVRAPELGRAILEVFEPLVPLYAASTE